MQANNHCSPAMTTATPRAMQPRSHIRTASHRRKSLSPRARQHLPWFDKYEVYDDTLAHLMSFFDRVARRSARFTRADLADELKVSPSAIIKYLRGEREIPNPATVRLSRKLNLPRAVAPKVAAALLPGFYTIETGSFPPQYGVGDLDLLNSLSCPGMLNAGPDHRIMAVNQPFLDLFPWLPEPTLDRPVNFAVEIFTNPGAKESFGASWPDIAAHIARTLQVFCAGVVPAERMGQLFEACRKNPQFDRYMEQAACEVDFPATVLTVLCQDGQRRPYVLKTLNQALPDPTAFDLVTLTRLQG
ncbi:helix-turn-helix domain-containing protein [Nocardia tengchongensis]|uniref:helix-turn-helix domain-containing protein n=1 Tax=Nocardia tengchongensis TaxID=2055889 RepID=UPI0036A19FF9